MPPIHLSFLFRSVLTVLLIHIGIALTAQSVETQPYFSISYFGLLGAHPGIKFGFQYPVASFQKEDAGRNLDQIVAGANVLIYYHRRNHLGMGVAAELGFRNRRYRGLNKEAFASLGYLRTFRPNRAYRIKDDGEMTFTRWSGQSHLLKTVGLGLGWNQAGQIPGDFFMVRPTLLHLKPFGTAHTLNVAFDVAWFQPY